MPPVARPPLTGVRFRYGGAVHRTPPLSLIPPGLRLRGRLAPVEQDFRSWVTDHADAQTADFLSALAGVYTFYHDPGELSAAFVWSRTQRLLLNPRPAARFIAGGWTNLVDALERRARELRVRIITGERVDTLTDPPVIVALSFATREPSSMTTLSSGRADRRSASTSGSATGAGTPGSCLTWIAPGGSSATQRRIRRSHPPARRSCRANATPPRRDSGRPGARLEELLDASFEGWRERTTWRRRQLMDGRSGALDLPGTTWRERPAIDRGGGIFLCGDQVAADGCLSEVSFASAAQAAQRALELVGSAAFHRLLDQTRLPSQRALSAACHLTPAG